MIYTNDNSGHGGARPGAGRPKAEKTVQIRVPESLIDQVKKLIDQHKKHAEWLEGKGAQNVAPEIKKELPAFSDCKAKAYGVLNALTKKERRVYITRYGSMSKAAEALAKDYFKQDK